MSASQQLSATAIAMKAPRAVHLFSVNVNSFITACRACSFELATGVTQRSCGVCPYTSNK
jgi:hypothetical protein